MGSTGSILSWLDENGQPFSGAEYDIHKVSPYASLPGLEQYEERRRIVLEHYADNSERRPIWSEVARYALGRYERGG